jgi:hypothetical protein
MVVTVFLLQDTPGFQNEGPETEAILSFINDGNVAYMNHEQVCPSSNYEDLSHHVGSLLRAFAAESWLAGCTCALIASCVTAGAGSRRADVRVRGHPGGCVPVLHRSPQPPPRGHLSDGADWRARACHPRHCQGKSLQWMAPVLRSSSMALQPPYNLMNSHTLLALLLTFKRWCQRCIPVIVKVTTCMHGLEKLLHGTAASLLTFKLCWPRS